ncbi:hypothetical protein quinque_011020 [Culex quinquefasciatus]
MNLCQQFALEDFRPADVRQKAEFVCANMNQKLEHYSLQAMQFLFNCKLAECMSGKKCSTTVELTRATTDLI